MASLMSVFFMAIHFVNTVTRRPLLAQENCKTKETLPGSDLGGGIEYRQSTKCQSYFIPPPYLVYLTKTIKTKQPADRQLKFMNKNFF
jgi:hypothetical protein